MMYRIRFLWKTILVFVYKKPVVGSNHFQQAAHSTIRSATVKHHLLGVFSFYFHSPLSHCFGTNKQVN